MTLAGRVAVVTGANRGLGQAVAARLARDGAHVVLAARDEQALAETENQIRASGLQPNQLVVSQQTDVAKPEDVDRLLGRALEVRGKIDVLICNAGIYGPMGRVEDLDWDEWIATIQINLLGTVLCCRSVLPSMRRQQSGKIVIISGGGATQPLPNMSAYAASKAAVVRFAETLAKEVFDAGIQVNSVAPGALNTRLLEQVLAAGPERVGHQFFANAVRQQQEGGTPLEAPAELIAFLASPASDGVTGRLISAVWDDWRSLPAQREQLAASDVFTLRRIVPQDRGWGAQ
jgi:NAD(P)-dependent dehydrogenase (short-subunit alcohol dehydrogenase family)